MKKIFLLTLLLSLFAIYSQAQAYHDLEIFSEDGLKFTVIMNGKVMNETPQSNVKLTDLQYDQVHIVIKFENEEIPDIKKKYLQISEPGTAQSPPVSTVYKIIYKKGVYKLRFMSRIEKNIQIVY